MLTAYFSRYDRYRLFDIFIFVLQEEEQKKLIALEEAKKLSMENEARRKLEEQKIKREPHNKAMNMDLLRHTAISNMYQHHKKTLVVKKEST